MERALRGEVAREQGEVWVEEEGQAEGEEINQAPVQVASVSVPVAELLCPIRSGPRVMGLTVQNAAPVWQDNKLPVINYQLLFRPKRARECI